MNATSRPYRPRPQGGANAEEMSATQGGNAADPKTAATLRFALQLVEARAGLARPGARAGRSEASCSAIGP